MIDGDGIPALAKGFEMRAVLAIGGAGRLEDQSVGEEPGKKSEKEVNPRNGLERPFPRPLSNEDFLPIH